MINGLGLTFMEYSMNGQRIVAHGGDTVHFHSDMVLVPRRARRLFHFLTTASAKMLAVDGAKCCARLRIAISQVRTSQR